MSGWITFQSAKLARVDQFSVGVDTWRWIRLPKVPATPQSDLLYWPLDGSNSGYSFGGLLWIDETAKAQTRAAIKGGQTFPPVTITDTTYQQK